MAARALVSRGLQSWQGEVCFLDTREIGKSGGIRYPPPRAGGAAADSPGVTKCPVCGTPGFRMPPEILFDGTPVFRMPPETLCGGIPGFRMPLETLCGGIPVFRMPLEILCAGISVFRRPLRKIFPGGSASRWTPGILFPNEIQNRPMIRFSQCRVRRAPETTENHDRTETFLQ